MFLFLYHVYGIHFPEPIKQQQQWIMKVKSIVFECLVEHLTTHLWRATPRLVATYLGILANVSFYSFSSCLRDLLILKCMGEAPISHCRDLGSSPRGETLFWYYVTVLVKDWHWRLSLGMGLANWQGKQWQRCQIKPTYRP